MSLLKVSGTKVVDEEGKEIILRGAGLGGWMKWVVCHANFLSFSFFSMENFISGIQSACVWEDLVVELCHFQVIPVVSSRSDMRWVQRSDKKNPISSSTK